MISLCAEVRYVNVTLPTLLERAGVDEAAFERDFADLEDCFCQIFEAQRDELALRVANAFAAEQGWANQLRAAAYALMFYLSEDLQRALFMREVFYAGERANLLRDQANQGFVALVDLGRMEMDEPDSLTIATAETITSAIYQRLQSSIENSEFEHFEKGAQEMMYMAVLPYLGPEAAQEELTIPPPPFPSR
jgi:AcrR family transcriptional regulator